MKDKLSSFLAIPIEFIKSLTGARVNENDTVNFNCELNKPNINVKWFRDGELIQNGISFSYLFYRKCYKVFVLDEHFEIQAKGPIHTLTIHNVAWNEGGEYKCIADGGAKTSATLLVKGNEFVILYKYLIIFSNFFF